MTDEDVVFSTAETELMTLRMQVEYWRLEAQRLADLLAELDQDEQNRQNALDAYNVVSATADRLEAKADKLAEALELLVDAVETGDGLVVVTALEHAREVRADWDAK